MPPGEGQGRGRGRVSAGEGGGGRPAGSPASSSRAGGGACPRRLLPLGSAPALEARVRVGASKRVCSPSSSLSPVVRTGLGRRRLSGSLASRCGPSGWERRRSARAGRRRLRAPRRYLSQSVARVDGCVVLPAPRGRLSEKPRPTATGRARSLSVASARSQEQVFASLGSDAGGTEGRWPGAPERDEGRARPT